jgi:3'-phosphoadenosine 5'-phosphosulfate sulfotransferase (PAPS reductase)/FAD synthetase
MTTDAQTSPRHILSLSGGKDSTALAIYMRGRIPEMEYVFCDTGEELKETEEYLDKIEVYLGKEIHRLNPDRPFKHYLQLYNGVLPDARTRWCTRKLKIVPFERFVGDDLNFNYVGIRADEAHRKGYISTKPNIFPKYPFIEDGIAKDDVFRILQESGLGLPKYYEWRSRSGCYFCFFQQRIEWVGLLENHPDLFDKAMEFEKVDPTTGEGYSWNQGESLKYLKENSRRRDEIKVEHARFQEHQKNRTKNQTLSQVFGLSEVDGGGESCLICHL